MFKNCLPLICQYPGLNPLDYSLWGQSMEKVWEVNSKTIQELKAVVEKFFARLGPDLFKKSVMNIKNPAKLCIRANCVHFEHLM